MTISKLSYTINIYNNNNREIFIGLKFLNSFVPRPCFLINGLTWPIFFEAENLDLLNELFTILAIMTDSLSQHSFMISLLGMSSGDFLYGAVPVESSNFLSRSGGNR